MGFVTAPQSSSQVQPDQEFTEKERRRRLTRLTIHTLMVAVAGSIILSGLSEDRPLTATWPVLTLATTLLLTAKLFLHFGKTRAAAWTIVAPSIPIVTFSMCFYGGVGQGGGLFIILCVLVAATTLGRRAARWIAGLGVLSVGLVAWGDASGLLHTANFPLSPLRFGAQVTLVCLASSILLDALIRSLHEAQAKANAASEEKAEVESRYVSAQKMEPVGRLASGVAHDFNNLLSVMTSVSTALRNSHASAEVDDKNEESVHELLDDLDEATARASLMTGQLLSFSRRRAFEVDSINLDEMLDSITPMLSRLLGDEIAVQFHGSVGSLSLEADRGQMEQIVLNLAVNARDAMPQGGNLTISIGQDEESASGVFLEVKDTGVGMSPELVDDIFQPFFTTKPTGTGLGLSTVHDIVTRLCGEIDVDSTPEGGTTIRLRLPATSHPTILPRPSIRRQKIGRQTSARVLLTEDHELLRRATQRSLEQVGYAVTSVFNGHEALVLLKGGATFDVLVTDISMPKMGGVDLALSLEEQGLNLPIVFISGNTGRLPREVEHLSIKPRFLAKPFDQGDFLEAIEKSIGSDRTPSVRLRKKDGAA